MTDRELLEAAARAAGPDVFGEPGLYFRRLENHCVTSWNPLVDDGDAFRLAVKLRIKVVPEYVYEGPWLDGGSLRDPYAATRRAIVRAAAQIGGKQ